MKRIFLGLLVVFVVAAASLSVMAARFVPTIRPNTQIGMVPVGGLTKEEAAKKLRIWWESERKRELNLRSDQIRKALPAMTPGKLGVTLDDQASVAQAEIKDFWEAAQATVTGGNYEPVKLDLKFKQIDASLKSLDALVRESIGEPRAARVTYAAGAVVREPEVTTFELDVDKLGDAVLAALAANGDVEVPIKEAPKRVPDDELAKIVEVESEFSTRFPAYQTSRNTNIRLAASALNGQVLMPGDQLSFNGCVGRRTVAGGYKEAPVLKNGMHDTGIGGGICQVSTTLYNASLFADLKIVKRNNHSIPSVYVPVGRDATVDYGTLDLVIENNQDHPIAVSSTFENGKITFRILGKKDVSREVKILTSGHKSWSNGVKTVVDRSLPAGTTRVVEKGSSGHSITTYRVVYENGVEVRREVLNRSVYRGSPRIVATNNAPAAPKKAEPLAAPSEQPDTEPTIPPLDN
ncbi:MAG: hypothetical protein BGO01_00715 [Armatimonadetes bacterium 55-13]|nr:VanW family protein [Armatimonadota bacterium]OJU62326.1 MAG: hypothetical protein BGO01_00715 [Armatimonadetes bacterium 55-13]